MTLRAEIAAKQGDTAASKASIDEGLALWAVARRAAWAPRGRSIQAFADWEAWARGHLAEAG
jgi:hypothetical protein